MESALPIFEYRCDACDVTFERIRRASDETPVECPECHEEARKLLSTFASRSEGARSVPSFGGGGGGGCSSGGG